MHLGKKSKRKAKKKNPTFAAVADRHQMKIARDTLKLSDVGAKIMGGMSKPEARRFLQQKGYSAARILRLENPCKTRRVAVRKKAVKKNPRKKPVAQMTSNELFKEFNQIMSKKVRTEIISKRLASVKKQLKKLIDRGKGLKTRKNPLVTVNPTRRKKSRINPKALAMFRKVHGTDPDKVVKVGSGDDTYIVLGEVVEIAYRIPFATKRDKGNTEWVHKFKKKPFLCLTAGGKPAIMFLKDHKINERGLIG